ncbi:triose-phosphate isomerase [Sinorhizobium meliloti]|uniref:triose-phosphate isomerase n=1 Tax=Rhizobium meliloti TaxID=382 RepID=UPI000FE0AFB3|nr:triose-phosphate isomerase [Sinorhizobium meliloti]MDW9744415.1 triose-phosphate isomerase [Sinorhizobium meliloti]MDW9817677.1 triose-phosphate isomerase [Sinorhizobium meliloti]MDX0263953.1 triose-phosphate isomerase [Sinorhizobium meliloti]MDX0351216.1 triose-phosphate isomerase [Sinorhizobium meliloti]RVL54354.1 triose-phosphate isomerase [Sinorhizobium meliloti]
MTPDIRPLVAGNWKMNGTRASLDQIKAMAEGVKGDLSARVDALICPPATLLYVATALCDDSPLMIGAQDCHQKQSGAHTGEVSAEMVADCFGTHVIVGHSERRTDHGEGDALVRAKTEAAHGADLVAIVCVGETEEERKAGRTLDILKRQLSESLPDQATAENTVIAYEPLWAIGTGLTPTVSDVEEAHAFMRRELVSRFGAEGGKMRILYGGSVKPSNAKELMGVANVDGALIGGASLKADDFLAIYRAYEELTA